MGALAGALTTVQLQIQPEGTGSAAAGRIAATGGGVRHGQVRLCGAVDDKKLISEAISGMVASLDPHSQYFDKKSFKNSAKAPAASLWAWASKSRWKTVWSKWCRPLRVLLPSAPRPQDQRSDPKIDDTAVKGLSINDAVKTHAWRAQHQGATDHSAPRRKPHLSPSPSPARKSRPRASSPRWWSRATAGCAFPSSRNARSMTWPASWKTWPKADPKMKGLVLDLRNDPRWSAGCRGRHFSHVPA